MDTVVMTLLAGAALLIIATVWMRYNNNGINELYRLSLEIEKIKKQPVDVSAAARKKLQNQIYALINKELAHDDHKVLYKTIDVLKLYLGEGLGHADDPLRITKIIYQTIQANETEASSYAIHAFVPLIRKSPAEHIPQAVEQLCIIAAVAMKRHKNFLTARAIEIILEGLERLGRSLSREEGTPGEIRESHFTESGAKAVKLVGLSILRGKDIALFREFCIKINEFISSDRYLAFRDMWPLVFAAWLNYLARKENEEAFSILLAHISSLSDEGKFDENALLILAKECRHMIVVSSLNPYNTFAAPMLSFFLNSAYTHKNAALWRQATETAQQASQSSLTRHGVKTAFSMIYPFLEIGRKMMVDNLKTKQKTERISFAEDALSLLVREWVKTAEYEARRNFILTVSDVILEIRKYWQIYPQAEGSPKSVNKFCHLLVIYWMRLRPKVVARANYIPLEADFQNLLTEDDLNKLAFLF